MVSYDINLYTSQELYDYCENSSFNYGYEALYRTKTYLDGAFNRTPHSATVRTKNDKIPAPQEDYRGPFTTSNPCGPGQIEYSDLVEWWIDYANCNLLDQGDVTMLITATDYISGGKMYNSNGFSVSITGKNLIEASESYQNYGMGSEYRAVRTPHHEFGHFAMGDVDSSHDWGDTFTHGTSDHYMTPMYVQGSANQCSEGVSLQGDRGWEQVWSDCCQGEW